MKPDNNLCIMQFFSYDHLPTHLQEVSRPFGDLAEDVHSRYLDHCEENGGYPEKVAMLETDIALRKLLEAKDAAMRAEHWW